MKKNKRKKKRKKKSELHSETLLLRLDPELKEILTMAAREKGVKPAQYLRDLVEEDLLIKHQITNKQS